MSNSSELAQLSRACEDAFAPDGRLAQAIEGFATRDEQVVLANAIAHAIVNKSVLVAEAGTGTGKTFAYLIPGLLSGKKILVSTATKTLQDQLYQKDLPLLKKALGLSARVVNLKGRSNYLCLYRIQQHATESRFVKSEIAHALTLIRDKLPKIKYGDKAELPEINEQDPVWPLATSTADNCLGKACSFVTDCFLLKARRKAMKAQVVVVNHHVFFADSRMKDEGMGELLPLAELVIFDEAHQIADIASVFQEQQWSTYQLVEILDSLVKHWPTLEISETAIVSLCEEIKKELDCICEILKDKDDRLTFQAVFQFKPLVRAFERVVELLGTLQEQVEACAKDDHAEIVQDLKRLIELKNIAHRFKTEETGVIRWVSRYKRAVAFHVTPVEVATYFSSLIARYQAGFVLTSATLTIASSFETLTRTLGLESATTLYLESPFDFKTQALLYLPRDMPDPVAGNYYDALLDKAIPVIKACGGRTFMLFTSHRALKLVAQLLLNKLEYPLLVQGEEPKHILLARFKSHGNAILLGTATFWEGIDVKGEALSCVMIDKLPFASPHDPVIAGKMKYYQRQGLSSFDVLTLPEAVLALKQGVGRLIRDVGDRGILMIADPRLTGRAYGQRIFASLPPFKKTRELSRVIEFIEQ